MQKSYFLGLALGSFALTPAFALELVQNGGFETDVGAPNGLWTTFFAGDTIPGGWIVGGHSVDVHNNHTPANTGAQSLDLSGQAAGSVSQSLATSPGASYVLSFYATPHSFGVYDKSFEVWWDGSLLDTVTLAYSSSFPWSHYTYNVTASAASTALQFVSLVPNGGPILDDVSVTSTAVPDQGSMVGAFASLSLFLLVGAKRRG